MDNKELQREKSLSYLDGCLTGLKFANSCKDAISKSSVYEILGNLMAITYELDRPITEKDVSESIDEINALPLVLPMYQQGKWIDFGLVDKDNTHEYQCSNCKNSVYDRERNIKYHKYCLHCGSRNEVE